MAEAASQSYQFGPFRFDVRNRQLHRDGTIIDLRPTEARLLLVLVEARGSAVSRAEIDERVWSDAEVGDGSLLFQVSELRRALGDDAKTQRFIKTVPRLGYRLAVPVQPIADVADTVPQSPTPPLEAQEPTAQSVRWRSRRGFLAASVGAGLLATAAAAAALWGRAPAPRVVAYRQLTHDGLPKDLNRPLLRDATGVYFYLEGKEETRRVPLIGGETELAPVGRPTFRISDLGSDRTGFVAVERTRSTPRGAVWMVSSRVDETRRLGSIECEDATLAPNALLVACVAGNSITIMNADGRSARPPVSMTGHIDWARWSPDSRTLRFSMERAADRTVYHTIWQIDANGTGLRQLLSDWQFGALVCCGGWSPDGRDFVFQTLRGQRLDLWLIEEGQHGFGPPQASAPVRLTDGPLEFSNPVWSADGRHIYAVGIPARGELVRFDNRLREFVPFMDRLSATWVTFSPDGQWLAYAAFPEATLWRARVDGTEKRQLTLPPMDIDGSAWSPDGQMLAFRGTLPGELPAVYVVPATGGTPRRLSDGKKAVGIPSWSPDGKRIVVGNVPSVFGQPDGGEMLSIFNVTTDSWSSLPGSAGLWTPRWSPDGRFLAALTIQGQRLRLLDLKTSGWRELGVAHLNNVTWSHDGRFIYYDTEGVGPFLRRVSVPEGKVEQLYDLSSYPRAAGWWTGLAPDDSPLILRRLGASEVYALDLEWN